LKHRHHIIPRHMGGTDDDRNIIEVTVEEHAELHRRLYMAFELLEDKLAWKMLEGQAMMGDNLAIKARLGWDKANANGPVCKGTKWWHDPTDPWQNKMLRDTDTPPAGWIRGRGKRRPYRNRPPSGEKQKAAARKQAKKMGKANAVPHSVRGLDFPSRKAAAKHFGVSEPTITNWMKKEAGS
jgi:hypothetical protein